MRLLVKLMPHSGAPNQKRTLPVKEEDREKEDKVKLNMRVVHGRLARKLKRAVKYKAEHDNYKELSG